MLLLRHRNCQLVLPWSVLPLAMQAWQCLRPHQQVLLHRQELTKIARQIQESGHTIVPLQLYFKDGRAKIEIGLARGRKSHDRRQELAKKDAEREMARVRRNVEKFG